MTHYAWHYIDSVINVQALTSCMPYQLQGIAKQHIKYPVYYAMLIWVGGHDDVWVTNALGEVRWVYNRC